MTEHFDRQAERSALGAVMLDPRRVHDVFDLVKPDDFHLPAHEQIATAITRVTARGESADVVMVGDELVAMKAPEHLNLHTLIHELTGETPSASMAGYYAELVAKHAARRRLALAVLSVKQIADDVSLSPDEQIDQARSTLDALTSGAASSVQLVGDSIDQLVASLDEPAVFTPTPWGQVNDVIGGYRPGAMYVVGARPAAGKTTFAMNSAIELAKHGNVVFVSLEMSEGELQKRMISQLAEVNMAKLVNNALDDFDKPNVFAAAEQIRDMRIAILDDPGATVSRIRAFVRSVSRKGSLSGLVVDYVGLLRGGSAEKSRQQVIGEFSREMKLLAKEFHMPVILLSQLNRESEKRPGKKPMISDLRESGDLEQDADVAILLSRDLEDPDRRGEVDVLIPKNRHGNTDELVLAWQGHFARMVDMVPDVPDWVPGY